ncbi:protein O-GlcNAcase isoform X2 [Lingula anatina]|uniref:protein O-GlcNAcase n=1 Tax=Lingula anatina TaxID=7574 RepID=A0A1S3JWK9_LINAN|nr:protein O-GlcNAcase isoform X2 [Lingula anatina]|eukprot:XP_013414451.1 protein O-GlcNAcase isoform X2 [Lingula anatina]
MREVKNHLDSDINSLNGNFLCGVVEGFYGRPWTIDQRRDLFRKMDRMGLNTYMYAPKDDYKHRAYWRELYSVEEAEHLTNLIEAAKENNITFYYAISPGLDITFSNTKEAACLKRKLEQVAAFGCTAFAILFDDIETEMCPADKELFQSFAHAQVHVTNEVYQHLNQPGFLFCPTEYCGTRAMPTVASSEYLNTVGSKLLPGIDIMWTGPRVVSKHITIQSIEEVTKVLQRPPVIWDNYHANDYDQKRLFLGPYDGRSTDLVPYLHGVLTNPNCEFEANFIPLHTIAQWSKSNMDGVRKDVVLSESPTVSDIRLETENIQPCSEEDIPPKYDNRYQPKVALKAAIIDWLPEFYTKRNVAPCNMPAKCLNIPPLANPCPPVPGEDLPPITNMNQLGQIDGSYMQPAPSLLPVNSLVEPSSAVPGDSSDKGDSEPMDYIPTVGIAPDCDMEPKSDADSNLDGASGRTLEGADNTMQVDTCDTDNMEVPEKDRLTYEDISLLVDLFYLPFEHGQQAVHLLTEFHWLKANSGCMTESKKKNGHSPLVEEWETRSKKFNETVEAVKVLAEKLFKIPNRSLLYDLYPYMWDMRGILCLLNSFIKWLGCNKAYRDAFMCGDQEPWMFRGGLAGEFQRMLPIDGAHDLFHHVAPVPPSQKMFTIRPYLPSDEAAVYEVCRKTCDDGLDGTEVFPGQPDLIGDKLVGGFINLSPEYCFVVEDEQGVFGYVLAALDAKSFYKKLEVAWISELCTKYPLSDKVDNLTPAEEIISSFHNFKTNLPNTLYENFPTILKMDILPDRVDDSSVAKRMLACVLSALKANGSIGAHCEVNVGDRQMVEFYAKLGFVEAPSSDQLLSEDTFLLVRRI